MSDLLKQCKKHFHCKSLYEVLGVVKTCESTERTIDEDDTMTSKTYKDWVDYWELLFPKVTTKQIDNFCAEYRDSDQELTDLIAIYNRCAGDMDVILETLMFASYSDEGRIRQMIDKLIQDDRVEAHEDYMNESPTKIAKREKKAAKEHRDFQKHMEVTAKQLTKSKARKSTPDEDSLVAAIRANREQHLKSSENLLDRLTEKYCQPTSGKKRKANKK